MAVLVTAKLGALITIDDAEPIMVQEGDKVTINYTEKNEEKTVTGAIRVICANSRSYSGGPTTCPPDPYVQSLLKVYELIIDTSGLYYAEIVHVSVESITSITVEDPEPPKPETKTVTGVKVVDGGDGYTEVSIPTVEQVIRANIQTSDGEIGTYPVNPNAKYKWYYKESTDTILGTESSYTVTSDNVGKTICIEVSVTGYEGTATWEATGVVTE